MSFADILRRPQRKPAPDAKRQDAKVPERPASATGSAEFWRAFLRQDAKPAADDTAPTSREPSWRSASSPRAQRPEPKGPSVEPAEIERELGLSRFASLRALQRLRRDFALKNHPDRVPSVLRLAATKRMMIANALIDSAMKRFQFRAAQADRSGGFESGERV